MTCASHVFVWCALPHYTCILTVICEHMFCYMVYPRLFAELSNSADAHTHRSTHMHTLTQPRETPNRTNITLKPVLPPSSCGLKSSPVLCFCLSLSFSCRPSAPRCPASQRKRGFNQHHPSWGCHNQSSNYSLSALKP